MGGLFRTQARIAELPPVCFVEGSPYVVNIHTLAQLLTQFSWQRRHKVGGCRTEGVDTA